MNVPRVNAVGVVECPETFTPTSAAQVGRPLRLVAGLVLVTFTLVVVATTAYSIGRYCLTSQSTVPYLPR